MKKIRIVSDSTCDLSPDLIEKYDITIIPLCVVMGEKSYYDGIEVTPDEIYKWADENKTTPKTAALAFDKTLEILKPFMDAKEDIIFMGISSKMSTTFNVVRLIGEQEEYDRLFVVDSLNLSTGIGLQVIKAAEMAANGSSAEEIVEVIRNASDRVRASFCVDTLTYLARGGRCSAATALVGSMLKLHPMIVVKDGSMGVAKKFRGKMPVVLNSYFNELQDSLLNAEPDRVFITHSGCDPEIIEQVKALLLGLDYFGEILITRAGGVISSHCGPGTLGILFYEKN